MRLPAYLIVFVLAILLASTTPVGTGAGAHEFDLLHPLFTHVHLVNGRILTHGELAQRAPLPEPSSAARPSVASDSSSGSGDGGLGVSPIGREDALSMILHTPVGFVVDEVRTPSGNEEAPPDPPPL